MKYRVRYYVRVGGKTHEYEEVVTEERLAQLRADAIDVELHGYPAGVQVRGVVP